MIDSIVLGNVPSLIAALPDSTGIETFSKQRITSVLSHGLAGESRRVYKKRRDSKFSAIRRQQQSTDSDELHSLGRLDQIMTKIAVLDFLARQNRPASPITNISKPAGPLRAVGLTCCAVLLRCRFTDRKVNGELGSFAWHAM